MKLKTYQLIIRHEKINNIAFFEKQIEKIKAEINYVVDAKDTFFRVEKKTFLQDEYSQTIIIIKQSLEEALSICEVIEPILKENNFSFIKEETYLEWDEYGIIMSI